MAVKVPRLCPADLMKKRQGVRSGARGELEQRLTVLDGNSDIKLVRAEFGDVMLTWGVMKSFSWICMFIFGVLHVR